MSVIEPQSEIYLLKCPIEADNNNQLTFASKTAQLNYFRNLPQKHIDACTFVRKDGVIRFPVSRDELLEYNYIMYKNDAYENRWIFAFVRNQTWINNGLVELAIETDAWQTWQFDIEFKRSLVEREHVNNDTVGNHTYPENLEYGDYVYNAHQYVNYVGNTGYMLCAQVTTKLDSTFTTNKLYGKIFQGCYIIAEPYSVQGAGYMSTIMGLFDSAGKGDAIVSVFVVPRSVATWSSETFKSGNANVPVFVPEDTPDATIMVSDFEFNNKVNTIDGYSPRNNKLLTAPYNYFTVSNGGGDVMAYKFEDFIANNNFNSNPHFTVVGIITQGAQIRLLPQNYRKGNAVGGSATEWDYGLNATQYPVLSWISDYYLNWRARNSQYIDFQNRMFALRVGGQFISSIASGGELGGDWFGESLEYIGEKWQQQHVAEITPPSAKGNVNAGDLQFTTDNDRFTVCQMTIKNEYARKIDDFFSAFGYKIMRNKVPNITGRQNWNYVKTMSANITGDIPTSDMQSLKAMFNKGVTLWHNPNTFMDYSQNNNIV